MYFNLHLSDSKAQVILMQMGKEILFVNTPQSTNSPLLHFQFVTFN